ncbi:hypothetical protein AWV80_05335 [Cupriavidus sp. UYMU48A]|nr:hypothetical protein AWV80_05335 [Cupriavidus sp. UYMU48A]
MLDAAALPELQYETVLHLIQNQMKNMGFGERQINWKAWDDFNAETPYALKLDRAGINNGISDTLGKIKHDKLPATAAQMVLLLLSLLVAGETSLTLALESIGSRGRQFISRSTNEGPRVLQKHI